MAVINVKNVARSFQTIIKDNGHLDTIYPYLMRKVEGVEYQRERLETDDGDFLDLDWSTQGSDKLLIISHGLEGSAERAYVKGMAKHFQQAQFDCLAWNCRSCSGELNRLPRFYHSGDTPDLDRVVRHALKQGRYRQIVMVGFSMGGNKTLKWLGEQGASVPSEIVCAIAISAPIDLGAASIQLARPHNVIYMANFMYTMKQKFLQKRARMDMSMVSLKQVMLAKNFPEWDEHVTAPLHGFKGAKDYYHQASSLRYLDNVQVPSLIINAQNDPFLAQECFPHQLVQQSQYLRLEAPRWGGHVGFQQKDGRFWTEDQALAFYRAINGDL